MLDHNIVMAHFSHISFRFVIAYGKWTSNNTNLHVDHINVSHTKMAPYHRGNYKGGGGGGGGGGGNGAANGILALAANLNKEELLEK